MGLNGDCEEQLAFEKGFISNEIGVIPESKKIFFKVENKGEVLWLFPEQIYGAFLSKLREFFSNHAERPDVVISVPPFYSAVERQAVLDACKIGNVNCLKLVNEDTAVALSYGFFWRKEFHDTNARNVAFLDFGHAKTTVTIASFTQKKVKILARKCSRNLGARNFDKTLLEKWEEGLKAKGYDSSQFPKARLRLLESIEKARIILSANIEAGVNIECLWEDNDFHKSITRTEFEEMIAHNVDELKQVMEQCIAESGLKHEEIHSIEMMGCGTRIPIIMDTAMKVFKKDVAQRTLHSDEAVARGCSLQAAMILPQYNPSPFDVEECNPIAVDVSWSLTHPHEGHQIKTKTLIPLKANFPTVKSLTFDNRHEPMEVLVSYPENSAIVKGVHNLVAWYHIEVPKPKHEKFGLKLRVKLDQNQIPSLDTAELVEEYKEEKKIPIKQAPAPAPPAPKEGEAAPEAPPAPEQQYETKLVDKTTSTNIHFKFEHHGFSTNQLNEYHHFENDMFIADQKIV